MLLALAARACVSLGYPNGLLLRTPTSWSDFHQSSRIPTTDHSQLDLPASHVIFPTFKLLSARLTCYSAQILVQWYSYRNVMVQVFSYENTEHNLVSESQGFSSRAELTLD